MTDYSELKRLAETWLVPDSSLHADAVASKARYANSILALIAENERLSLHSHCHLVRAQTVEQERDQARKLNLDHAIQLGGLQKERDQLKAEILRAAMSKGEQP